LLAAAVILLVFAVLFNIYATVDLKYIGGEFYWCVKYAFIKIISSDTPKKEKKEKKKKKDRKKKKSSGKKDGDDDESSAASDASGKSGGKKKKKKKKSVFREYLENAGAVIDFVKSSLNSILGLTRKIRVSAVCADCTVADTDAYTCALNYGIISAGIYNILAFVSSYFKTDIDHVNIGLKYNSSSEDSVYDFSTTLKLKPGSAVIAAIGILFSYLKLQIMKETENDKLQKSNISKERKDMEKHPVNSLMGTAIEKIREMIDVNTIIGNPISTPEGATIIPVSKVSFGFASGGSDLPSKNPKELFGGAAGAGVSVQPLAFICVQPDGEVKLLQMSVNATKENAMISTLPDLIDKISGLVNGGEKKEKPVKGKKRQAAKAADEAEEADEAGISEEK